MPPNSTYRVEFFAHSSSNDSEAKTSLGSLDITAGADGIAHFLTAGLVPAGSNQLITATVLHPTTLEPLAVSSNLALNAAIAPQENFVLIGSNGNDTLYGGVGHDQIMGNDGDDDLFGNWGEDILQGSNGADRLSGGLQGDRIWGNVGNDAMWGDEGADRLNGNEGGDRLSGGAEDDRLNGNSGRDWLMGNHGIDRCLGGTGSDTLWGNVDSDQLNGGRGVDKLLGGEGSDRLVGGEGDDKLLGGSGRNVLKGGPGNDQFVLDRNGFAEIQDFSLGRDRVTFAHNLSFDEIDYKFQSTRMIITLEKTRIATVEFVIPTFTYNGTEVTLENPLTYLFVKALNATLF